MVRKDSTVSYRFRYSFGTCHVPEDSNSGRRLPRDQAANSKTNSPDGELLDRDGGRGVGTAILEWGWSLAWGLFFSFRKRGRHRCEVLFLFFSTSHQEREVWWRWIDFSLRRGWSLYMPWATSQARHLIKLKVVTANILFQWRQSSDGGEEERKIIPENIDIDIGNHRWFFTGEPGSNLAFLLWMEHLASNLSLLSYMILKLQGACH